MNIRIVAVARLVLDNRHTLNGAFYGDGLRLCIADGYFVIACFVKRIRELCHLGFTGLQRILLAVLGLAVYLKFCVKCTCIVANVVDICREACKAAKAHGVKISCDLNYRGKLWTREEARAAMTDLCQYVDVCISNEEDAKDVFGIEAEATDIYAGEINREGYKSVAKQLADKFGFEKVAITLRESHSASDNGWSAMLYDVASNEYCFSKKYELRIIDRVGGGDSFGGGLIYALLNGKTTQEAVEFAVAASALKHSIEGDYNMVTVAEVEKLAGGDGSGRIQR